MAIPPPDYRRLLPPLLACLPTSFASSRPPPALPPLLSPILRQRVEHLSSTAAPSESWLPLLCWSSDSAAKLPELVESDVFELHPISGEIEFDDIEGLDYKRLDRETLHVAVKIDDLGLVVVYLWYEEGREWLVHEVKPLEDFTPAGWQKTIGDADACTVESGSYAAGQPRPIQNGPAVNGTRKDDDEAEAQDNDDDDYWARYDTTPGRMPAPNASPAPPVPNQGGRPRTTSEAEYFEQYAQVQPALDNDDPSENREAIGESSLDGNNIVSSNTTRTERSLPISSNVEEYSILQPIPSPPSASRASQLEDSAAESSPCEIAVQQHISTSIKSLFRLTQGAGIERQEFERMVRIELETLSMMERE